MLDPRNRREVDTGQAVHKFFVRINRHAGTDITREQNHR
jgi:hypothetical protein